MADKKGFEAMATSELLWLLKSNDHARGKGPGLRRPTEYTEDVVVLVELERRGMVAAHDALIGWNEDDRGRVTKVRVEPSDRLPSLRKMENLRGAGTEEGWPRGATASPEAVFLHLMESGFANRSEMVAALAGFANIIECGWARKLHTAAMLLIDPDYDRDTDNLEYENMHRAGVFDAMPKDYP